MGGRDRARRRARSCRRRGARSSAATACAIPRSSSATRSPGSWTPTTCSPTPRGGRGDVLRADEAAGHGRHRHRAQGGAGPGGGGRGGDPIHGDAQPDPAAVAARGTGCARATDVTGFGLVGHASNVARESGLTLEIEARRSAPASGRARARPDLPGRRAQGQPTAVRAPGGVRGRVPDAGPARPCSTTRRPRGASCSSSPEADAAALLADLPNARRDRRARPAEGDKPIVCSERAL